MWSAFTRGRSVFFFGFLAFLVLQILSGSALTSAGVKSVHHDVVAPGVHPGYYPGYAAGHLYGGFHGLRHAAGYYPYLKHRIGGVVNAPWLGYAGRAGCQYVPGVKGPVMRCGGLAGKGYLHNGYAYKK